MITYTSGNIFDADVEALVNPVNCVGVMGAGLAKQFKERFPENYQQYRWDCTNNRVSVGKMHVFEVKPLSTNKHRYIINFPTKIVPQERSQFSYIRDGINDLVNVLYRYEIQSVAIPKLGCGLGGLEWKTVRPVIDDMLHNNLIKHVNILIYQ